MKPQEPMTDQQRAVVRALNEARAGLRMRDKQFWQQYLPGDYWTWLNSQTDVVSAKTIAGYLAVLPEAQREAAAATAVRDRMTRPIARDFHHTKHTRLAEAVLRVAIRPSPDESDTPRRIILVLGPTGAGKSALRDYLALKYHGRICRATESAKTNFAAVHLGIQQAFGSLRNWATRIDLEQHTFNLLTNDPSWQHFGPRPVIFYDESLRWGPHAYNIAVDINDSTPAVQVIFALPQIVDKMSGRSFAESSQLMRRVLEVVELGEIVADDVRPFVAPLGLNGSTDHACRAIAHAATEYGRFDFVERARDAIVAARAHNIAQIDQVIADEREAIRVQRMTEKLREHTASRMRRRVAKYADAGKAVTP
jgi:hypothetical protein